MLHLGAGAWPRADRGTPRLDAHHLPSGSRLPSSQPLV